MKHYTLIFVNILFFTITAVGQSGKDSLGCASIKNGRLISAVLEKSKDLADKIKSKNISLVFDNEFDDSVVVYLNAAEVFRGYVKTNFSTGVADNKITLDPLKLKKESSIRIVLVKNNECMIAEIKTSYKGIHIFFTHKQWYLYYTNYRIWAE
ncbi:MAG: hypothetical protein ABI402_05140 [Ferruginibacter sp.]